MGRGERRRGARLPRFMVVNMAVTIHHHSSRAVTQVARVAPVAHLSQSTANIHCRHLHKAWVGDGATKTTLHRVLQQTAQVHSSWKEQQSAWKMPCLCARDQQRHADRGTNNVTRTEGPTTSRVPREADGTRARTEKWRVWRQRAGATQPCPGEPRQSWTAGPQACAAHPLGTIDPSLWLWR